MSTTLWYIGTIQMPFDHIYFNLFQYVYGAWFFIQDCRIHIIALVIDKAEILSNKFAVKNLYLFHYSDCFLIGQEKSFPWNFRVQGFILVKSMILYYGHEFYVTLLPPIRIFLIAVTLNRSIGEHGFVFDCTRSGLSSRSSPRWTPSRLGWSREQTWNERIQKRIIVNLN